MKRYVPLKYILGMIMMFFIVPVALIVLVCVIGIFNRLTIAIIMFLGALVIFGPAVYVKNQKCASIVIYNTQLINYMRDGELNFGWAVEIEKIKSIKIANNEEAKKYFKNCISKKVLLMDLDSSNVKYITVGPFTNRQLYRLIKDLQNINRQIEFIS